MGPEHVLTLLLEEFKTLRAQVLNDLDRQYSVTNWGVSAIAVLMAAIGTAWDKLRIYPTVVLVLLLLALPMIITAYVIAWSHILRSTLRAGHQLYVIEQRVARLFTDDEVRAAFHLRADDDSSPYRQILSWEHGLRTGKGHVLVSPAVRIVRTALAVVYIAVVLTSVFACETLYREPLVAAIRHVALQVACVGWFAIWILVSQYIGRAMSLGHDN